MAAARVTLIGKRGIDPKPFTGRSERAAEIAVVCSSALASAGALTFVAAGLAHGQAADVAAALAFGLPACLLFIYGARRIQTGDFARAALVCLVAGLITLAEVILVGLSAAYADPCFEVVHCTRRPTFTYIALNGATIVFVLAAVLGLIVSPLAIGLVGWMRHTTGEDEG